MNNNQTGFALAAAFAAVLSLAPPAGAQQREGTSLDERLSSFDTICANKLTK
jgi:hypothetical protein